MPYDIGTDPYLDPSTGVLRNSLGITTQAELDTAEADLTSAVLTTLLDHPIPGNFDLQHLQAIHRALFGSLFPWAGELRTVEMTKGTTRFANPEFLEKAAEEVFNKLHAENLLRDLPKSEYAKRFAHYYSEVNILHPFREGNGRTQRAFFSLLAVQSGYHVHWKSMDPAENLKASIAAYGGDEGGLVRMLASLIERGE